MGEKVRRIIDTGSLSIFAIYDQQILGEGTLIEAKNCTGLSQQLLRSGVMT